MQSQVLRDATGLNQALRSRRKQLRLTQEELGQRAGLAAKHVSRIENGTHEPKVSTLLVLGETGKLVSTPTIHDIFWRGGRPSSVVLMSA